MKGVVVAATEVTAAKGSRPLDNVLPINHPACGETGKNVQFLLLGAQEMKTKQ